MKGEVPDEEYIIPIGKADVKHIGTDVTIVTAGRLVQEALEAAKMLDNINISAEVIDLRSIQPWDKDCVFSSLAKTHRLVVAHEAVKSFGFGAEISATVAEEMMCELDAPIERVGAPFVPIPFNNEGAYLPNAQMIVAAVKKNMTRTF